MNTNERATNPRKTRPPASWRHPTKAPAYEPDGPQAPSGAGNPISDRRERTADDDSLVREAKLESNYWIG